MNLGKDVMKIPPVLFIIFNRPDTTNRVFELIKEVKPKQLFIAGDGPRGNSETDLLSVQLTRQIVNRVNWDCELHTLFQESNLGCKKGVVAAIDWFFNSVDSGIILEHDCLPHISFFPFCAELLEKYKNNNEVMMIGGNNYQVGRKRGKGSYYFSVFGHIWGWATWKRAWKHNDAELATWPEVRNSDWIRKFMISREGSKQYKKWLDAVFSGELATWDYGWSYSRWRQNGLSIVPNCNLVTNIGIDEKATHTKKRRAITSLIAEEILFPLVHPAEIKRNKIADRFTVDHLYLGYPLPNEVGVLKYLYARSRKNIPKSLMRLLDPYLKIRKTY